MNKIKTVFRSRHSHFVMAICVALALAVIIPLVVAAQDGYPNLYGVYTARVNTRAVNIDGTRVTFPHRYLLVYISNNTTADSGDVEGYLVGVNTTSARGAQARGNSATYDATVDSWWGRIRLDMGLNEVDVTGTGLLGVYIPRYCEGLASDGDVGVIDGSPVELEEGWNSVNVTTLGDIYVAIWPEYSDTIGEVTGIVGEGSGAQFVLYATDIVTDVDDSGDDVLTGIVTARVINGETTFVVGDQADGDIDVYMPYGTTGTLTAVGCTVDGEASIDLVEGAQTIAIVDTEESGGTITFDITTLVTFSWSGRVRGSAGSYKLQGNYTWFNLPEYLIMSGKLNAVSIEDVLPN